MKIVKDSVAMLVGAMATFASVADVTSGVVYESVCDADGEAVSLDIMSGGLMGRPPARAERNANEIVLDNGTNSCPENGICWTLPLKNGSQQPFAVTAESRFEDGTDGDSGSSCYALYLDIHYADGTNLYGQKHTFACRKSIGWQRGVVSITPDKPIRNVSCYLLFRRHDGRVRFRAPKLKLFGNDSLCIFDSTSIHVANAANEPALLLHDAARDDDGWEAISDGATAKGLRATVGKRTHELATHFRVRLDSLTDNDRAVTLAYSIPLPEGELVWLDDPRTEVAMGNGQYRATCNVGCGNGGLSRWPFSAVRAGDRIYAIGFDPLAPGVFRVVGNGRLRRLFIAFDLGFAKEKRDARVGFVTFDLPAKDGFRGALEHYAKIMPEAFRVRIRKHGIWMAFRPISKVQGWEDFGFGIKEGDGEPAWDDEHGILTTHYTEPTTWWMTIRATNEVTIADALALAEAEAKKETRRHPYAMAWKNSTYLDEYGEITGRICDRPWCKGAIWNMCPLPGIIGGEYAAKLSEESFAKRYRGTLPNGVDGEYIDSAECHLPPRADFNRAHFAASVTPLCWAGAERKPCVSTALAIYEYVRGTAERVHALGRIMQANGCPMNWPWLFPFVDYGGQETKWIERGEGAWQPMSDRDLLYRMALSYGKPYCFLMNVKFENMTDEMVEKYFQRCLAYGLMSSFFSPNASGDHYFTRPDMYNRHRHLFKKYGTLQSKVSEAGWRAVNRLVKVEDGNVFAEQFGDNLVTVFNSGDKPATATLRRMEGTGKAKELVTDSEWSFGADGRLTVIIAPETVRVIRLN